MTTGYVDGVDAVRADGGLVHIRTVVPGDLAALERLHENASDRSLYLRFFTVGRETARRYVPSLAQQADECHHALLASIGDEVVGVACYERASDAPRAEVALLVGDDQQQRGIGTLLLEQLAEVARAHGIRGFVAEALSENTTIIRVMSDLGLPVQRSFDSGVVHIELDLELDDGAVRASDRREARADVASLEAVLAPRSVAVIGASQRSGSVGHQLLRNIVDGGFTGSVYAVNPHATSILGVPSVGSVDQLPERVDLAVVAVPAIQVRNVVHACGVRGVRGIVLVSSGFGETGSEGRSEQDELVRLARRWGIRLIGPNCLGVLNTDPAVRLNATFAPLPMSGGGLALASQSGALGIAIASAAARSGLGVAQFVSMGNKADVSGNDLLLAWEHDDRVKVIGLYLESFGNPRKFARIARRVAASKPVIAIKGGRTPAGQQAGRSHTAAAASADVVVDALFAEAGVLRVDTMEQMLDVARVLATQDAPAGRRVAIVGNSGGPQILAADAASSAGLDTVTLDEATVQRLRDSAPGAAAYANPVDLGAAADAMQMGRALQVLLDAEEVDAILTVFTETAVGDPSAVLARIAEVAAQSPKPVIATLVGGVPGILPSGPGSVPVFAFPEPAARALGVSARYHQIRSRSDDPIVRVAGTDPAAARAVVGAALDASRDWLDPDEVARLLVHYGVTVCPQRIAADIDAALLDAIELGYPLAVKSAASGLHKSELGAVHLDVRDEQGLKLALEEIAASVPGSQFLLQPMATAGTELIIGAMQHDRFGPVVLVGAGGVLADLVADRQFALAPVSIARAEQMVGGLHTARLLDGYRGRPTVSRAAVAGLVCRIAQLVDDVPEIAELDLNPVLCNGTSLVVVDARVRVAPAPTVPNPVMRQLPAC